MTDKPKNKPQPNRFTNLWLLRWIVVNGIAAAVIFFGFYYLSRFVDRFWAIPAELIQVVGWGVLGFVIGGLQSLELPFRNYCWQWFQRSAVYTAVIFLPAAIFVALAHLFNSNLSLVFQFLGMIASGIAVAALIIGFPIYQIRTLPCYGFDVFLWLLAYWTIPGSFYLIVYIGLWAYYNTGIFGSGRPLANLVTTGFFVNYTLPVLLFGVITARLLKRISYYIPDVPDYRPDPLQMSELE